VFRKEVRAAGHTLLVDDSRVVSVRGRDVQILGARWTRGDTRSDAGRRMRAMVLPGAFPILLAHHPHVFDGAEGIPLTLSGHTHGGGIMLNERLGAGPVMFRYWSGLYRREARTLVVSNGAGNWFPLRVHAPAEIARLTLRVG
jgi:predicted MPP superfamily phosphohydrolase